jgi:hypothetical protein
MGLPYAREIDRHMLEPGLIIQEHDIELGPRTMARFEQYVEKQPGRIHVAPYLVYFSEGFETPQLCWVHRRLAAQTGASLVKKEQAKLVQYLEAVQYIQDGVRKQLDPAEIYIGIAISVQGGEPESEYYGLGYTYIPKAVWDMAYSRVMDVSWLTLDTKLSQATLLQGQKAVLHWDCVASHWHTATKEVVL